MTGRGSFISARYDVSGNQMNDPALDNVAGSYPGVGVAVSTGSAWDTSIDPATLKGFTYMNEVPSGIMDGSNGVFTLAHIPTSDARIIFDFNGLMKTVAGGDFTRVGAVCTFDTSVRPVDAAHGGTDVLLANYS